MSYPIIMIHRGDSPYLAHAIAQAKSSNPESRVILIGDRSNSYYLGIEHYDYRHYFDEAAKFSSLFEYKYFPSYQHSWMLFNHQKYFCLRDFCREKNIEQFLLIDSDVMLYEDITPYYNLYKGSAITLIKDPGAYVAGAWFTFVQDLIALEKICSVFIKLYSNEGEGIRERLNLEMYSEMNGLRLFMDENPVLVSDILDSESQGFVINASMEYDGRFEYDGQFVKVTWEKNIPYLIKKGASNVIKAPMLHFHGKGKYVMGKYLRLEGRGIKFIHAINKMMNLASKYPMRLVNIFNNGAFPKI
jgi:hypothetical protein